MPSTFGHLIPSISGRYELAVTEYLLTQWNNTVEKNDTVYILGDLFSAIRCRLFQFEPRRSEGRKKAQTERLFLCQSEAANGDPGCPPLAHTFPLLYKNGLSFLTGHGIAGGAKSPKMAEKVGFEPTEVSPSHDFELYIERISMFKHMEYNPLALDIMALFF